MKYLVEQPLKKLYQVFSVDTCFTSFAIEYQLVGAESKEDLINHIPEIFKDLQLITPYHSKDEEIIWEGRIEEVEHMFTDDPYKVLITQSYYE